MYKRNGGSVVKQQVKLGLLNDNAVVVQEGLTDKDELFLTIPPEPGKLTLIPLAVAE